MRKVELRAWATPLTIATFVLMAGTGVLMFFGVNTGITDVIHQWFSWLFLLAVCAHLTMHVRSILRHMQSTSVRLGVGLFATILVLSLFSWGTVTGPQLKRPIERAMLQASVNSLATVKHVPSATLVARFSAIGVDTTGRETIEQLSQRYRISPHRLLAVVFAD
jgi:cytochrome bd-type quinol oxidase subunit 2